MKTLVPVLGEPAAYNDVGYIALLDEDYQSADLLLVHAMERSPTFHEAAARNLEIVRERVRQKAARANSVSSE